MLGLGRAEDLVPFLVHYSMLLFHATTSSCDGIQLFLSLRSKSYVCLREWWKEVKQTSLFMLSMNFLVGFTAAGEIV